jgi:hypothetical protein
MADSVFGEWLDMSERGNESLVFEALRELVHEGTVKFHSAKGMSYRIV